MMFDNTAPPSPTRWEMVKGHAPIVMLIGGALALFISLHTAAFAIAVVAALHVVVGALVVGAGWLRRRNANAGTGADGGLR